MDKDKPVCLLTMGDVQALITALNESKLSESRKAQLRRKLDKMQDQLMHVSQLVVR